MEYKLDMVSFGDQSMKYLRFGEGSKALVILPGLSVQSVLISAPAIVNQYRSFTKDFTVYLFDRRMQLPQSYDICQMAEDTAAAVRSAGLSDICIFGASQGGAMAMTIAAMHPELVKKLAVASTTLRVDKNSYAVIKNWIRLAEKGDKEGLYLSFGEMLYPPFIFEGNKDAFIEFSKTVTDEELRRFIILARGMEGFDLTDKARQIKCPVMMAYDNTDKIFPENVAREISALFSSHPGYTEKRYSGYGHAVYDLAPDLGKNMLSFFIGR